MTPARPPGPARDEGGLPAALPLCLLASLILVLCAISTGLLATMRREAFAAGVTASRNLVVAQADDIRRSLLIYTASIASAASLVDNPALAGASPAVRHMALFDRSFGMGAVLGPIRLLDPDGRVLDASDSLSPVPASAVERDVLSLQHADPSTGIRFGWPLDNGGHHYVVPVSVGMRDAQGRFAGAAIGMVRLDGFDALFRQLRLGPGDVVSLFLVDGTMLAHAPDHARVGTSIAGSEVLQVFQAHRSGAFVLRSSYDQVRRLFTLVHLDGLPLMLDVGLSMHDLYAPWRRTALVLGLLTVGTALAASLVLLRLQRELDRRRHAEAAALLSESRYRMIADNAADLIIQLDRNLIRTYVSPSCRRLGYEPEALLGQPAADLVHPDDHPVAALLDRGQDGRQSSAIFRIRTGEGRYVWVEAHCNGLADGGMLAILRDIDERKRRETELQTLRDALYRLASTDPLTGLPNRRSFDQGLDHAWHTACQTRIPLALLLIDVDRFKPFNDRYGHPAGDAALRRVAGVLATSLNRPGDLATRYGGEEFAVILPGADLYGGIEVAGRIRDALHQAAVPHADAESGILTVSIGVSSALPHLQPVTVERLTETADRALYAAKRDGRDRISAQVIALAVDNALQDGEA